MTRERAKELLPIIIGISEGKTIQFWNNNIWEDTSVPSLTHEAKRYRIKPKPQYRPFKNAKEFEPYRDRWVLTECNQLYPVQGYDRDCVKINDLWSSYENAKDNYTFDDGTPFGILDEVQDEKI